MNHRYVLCVNDMGEALIQCIRYEGMLCRLLRGSNYVHQGMDKALYAITVIEKYTKYHDSNRLCFLALPLTTLIASLSRVVS